ncbi:uncharacterized protein BP5553_09765 [Venustampulla echinocandica]|uniref:Uncharacterized protein n=1 Tax=Venustampulla echinocandica TaxID=2656787 RepID=A0A370TBZ5_9HELO|nr:uncharacterized protein BP5553_09765 [Venustampulla echinocandica]RDL31556.1 hypothetical protein BP5553_09765 [Venustampulla echinocandica]
MEHSRVVSRILDFVKCAFGYEKSYHPLALWILVSPSSTAGFCRPPGSVDHLEEDGPIVTESHCVEDTYYAEEVPVCDRSSTEDAAK